MSNMCYVFNNPDTCEGLYKYKHRLDRGILR
jgi:hypothetical protein